MNESRTDVLTRALQAELGLNAERLDGLFTEDVSGWSPIIQIESLAELEDLQTDHDASFSNVTLSIRGVDEVGDRAVAEWQVDADHTGPLVLGDTVWEASDCRLSLAGCTVADFRDGRILSFRTYFDELSLIEQMTSAG